MPQTNQQYTNGNVHDLEAFRRDRETTVVEGIAIERMNTTMSGEHGLAHAIRVGFGVEPEAPAETVATPVEPKQELTEVTPIAPKPEQATEPEIQATPEEAPAVVEAENNSELNAAQSLANVYSVYDTEGAPRIELPASLTDLADELPEELVA